MINMKNMVVKKNCKLSMTNLDNPAKSINIINILIVFGFIVEKSPLSCIIPK
jgi:hypothetical protein